MMGIEALPFAHPELVIAWIGLPVTAFLLIFLCVCWKRKDTSFHPQNNVYSEPGSPHSPPLQSLCPRVDPHAGLYPCPHGVECPQNGVGPAGHAHTRCREEQGARPKAHDQRALPDIPVGRGRLREEDQTYDVIPQPGMVASAITRNVYEEVERDSDMYPLPDVAQPTRHVYTSVDTPDLSTPDTPDRHKPPHHPYARVDSPSSISNPYARVDSPTMSSNNPYARVDLSSAVHPYARVESPDITVGSKHNLYSLEDSTLSATYARIEERKGATSSFDSADGGGLPGRAPRASIETLDDASLSYQSLPGPPVPDKRLGESDLLGLRGALADATTPPGDSPPSHACSASSHHVTVHPVTSHHVTLDHMTSQQPAAYEGVVMGDMSRPTSPPYSAVTARESLAHIRQRQALERPPLRQFQTVAYDMVGASSSLDSTYESVNYDEIKRALEQGAPCAGSDGAASDLYAEIAASHAGGASGASSVYMCADDVRGEAACRRGAVESPYSVIGGGSGSESDPLYSSVPGGAAAYDTLGDVYAVVDRKPRHPDEPRVDTPSPDCGLYDNAAGYQTIGSLRSGREPDYDNIGDGSQWDRTYERVPDIVAAAGSVPDIRWHERPPHVYQEIREAQRASARRLREERVVTPRRSHHDDVTTAL